MKKLLLLLLFLLVLTFTAYAGTITLSTYYPAPFGSYDRLRLVPRDALTCNASLEGLLYYDNTAGALQVCQNAVWDTLEVWTHEASTDNVFLENNDIDEDGVSTFVGIGTTTPLANLHIESGGGNPVVLRLQQTESDDSTWELQAAHPANDFVIWGGHEGLEAYRMTIDGQTGNVGIGTTTPGSQLHVTGGDVYVETLNSGIILRDTDGGGCHRITVDSTGLLTAAFVVCP